MIFTGLLAIATLLYGLLFFAAAIIARRKRQLLPFGRGANLPTVSLIVAARNEEDNLQRCLDALSAQDYPAELIEIIVANDHSTDGTGPLLSGLSDGCSRMVVFDVRESEFGLRGKANAIHQAFLRSKGEVILTTDADCFPPPCWARSMASYFADPATGVVCGVTLVEHEKLLDRIQALDWSFLLSLASAAIEVGRPITAMGNNMAFRRQAYEAVGGYPALPFSVTEDYAFFRAVHENTGWRARLPMDPALRNFTRPLNTLHAVFRQRKRWARGGIRAKSWVHALYLLTFLTHLLILLAFFLQPLVGVLALATKCLADYYLLRTVCEIYDTRKLLRTFPLFELYLFAYVIILPLALTFSPKIKWKDRRF